MKHISPGISVPIITSPTTASINISSSVVMNGSLVTSGSIDISGSITIGDDIIFVKGANFTSSWANNAVSSSYATTASYAINGGGAGNNVVGITTLDFGSAPGTNTATTTITTAAVNNNSSINIYIMSTASLNHNAEDHQVFALYSKVIPTNVIDNTSFDIVGISDLRINGEFKVKYNIIN